CFRRSFLRPACAYRCGRLCRPTDRWRSVGSRTYSRQGRSVPAAHSSANAIKSSANKIVVIGASAGALQPLLILLSGLPVDFAPPILVAMHLSPAFRSSLPIVIGRRTKLEAKWACDGEKLEASTIYVAPVDHHLRVSADFRLDVAQTTKCHWRP